MSAAANLQWLARRLVRRVGVPGMAALLLTLALPGLILLGVGPLSHEVEQLHVQLAQKPVEKITPVQVATPEQSLAAELDAFRSRFPAIDELSDQLDALFELTDKHGLTVDKGEYALVEKAGGAMRRFEVTLPVTGSYPQIQALMRDVLDQLPAAALADVSLERDKIADGRVNATLRLVFFVRKGA